MYSDDPSGLSESPYPLRERVCVCKSEREKENPFVSVLFKKISKNNAPTQCLLILC